MRVAAVLSSTLTLIALNLFAIPLNSIAFDLSEQEIVRSVGTLINSKGSIHIQGIKVGKGNGQLNLEISADLGNCWGKKEYSKRFVMGALRSLYTSGLPISHVLLNVYEGDQILLTVALGRNQAQTIDWNKQESLNAFYERMKSRTNYQGDPADYSWLIEMKDGLSR
jgi:hypothetical protein